MPEAGMSARSDRFGSPRAISGPMPTSAMPVADIHVTLNAPRARRISWPWRPEAT